MKSMHFQACLCVAYMVLCSNMMCSILCFTCVLQKEHCLVCFACFFFWSQDKFESNVYLEKEIPTNNINCNNEI